MADKSSGEAISSNPRLLFLSCSQSKRSTDGELPASERYDGPAFRVMNKFLRLHPSEKKSLDVFILSAKFGLIPDSKQIPNYDLRMTAKQVNKWKEPTLNELKQILNDKQYHEFFISMGKDYLSVLDGYESLICTNLNVTVSQGSMGRKLTELRNWLYEDISKLTNNQTKIVNQGKASLRGINIELTSEQILKKINQALTKECNIPKFQTWYVQVGNQQVPIKWVVSLLTGLSVSAFHTNEAKRVLQKLGIEVYSKL